MKDLFYLTTHSTGFTVIWTTQITTGNSVLLLHAQGKMLNILTSPHGRTATATHHIISRHSSSNGKEMFHLRTHSTHFIYNYMTLNIW